MDAHQHFWDPGRADYAFLTDELSAIRRPFEPDQLRPELTRAGVELTVLVQTRSSMAETREFLATAQEERFVGGVVGWVDLTASDVARRIEELREAPGGDYLVGIRHQVHDEPDPGWLLRDDVQRGLAIVGEAGLAYDLLVRTRELPAAVETCRVLPDVRFVLDHLAKPPIVSGDLSVWGRELLRLAELPNVTAKISGLVTEAEWNSWSIDDLRHPVDLAVEAFGPSRLMLGSDWPVCLLAGTYSDVRGAAVGLLSELPPHQFDEIDGGTAMRVYRLQRPRRRAAQPSRR